MMKKMLALSLILCFIFQQSAVFAQDFSTHGLILAQNELSETKKGKGYITELEKAIPSLTDIRLESILSKIEGLSESSLEYSASQNALIRYLDLAIQKELLARNGELSNEELQEIEDMEALSKAQIRSIETEIIAAQKLIQKNLETTTLSLQKTWETMSHYEETGTMNMDFDMNIENLGSIDSGLSLKNYSVKQKDFDQQLSGKFEAFLNATFMGQDIKASGSSLIDFISKDGNMYFLAKNLETKFEPSEMTENMGSQDILAKLKELASKNTYIKISDPQAAQGIEILRNISPKNILTESSKIFQTALLTPIAKKGESYVLIPSRHLCDSMKELSGILDPFSGKTCSESQYKTMISEMQALGIEILYTPGINKKIELQIHNESEQGSMQILWDTKDFLSLSGNIADIQTPLQNFMTLSFIPQSSFDLKLLLSEEETQEMTQLNVNATLSTDEIKTLHLDANIDESAKMNVEYKNKFLDANLSYIDPFTSTVCSLFGPLTNTTSQLEGKCNFKNAQLKNTFGSSTIDILFGIRSDRAANKNNLDLSLRAISNKKEFMKFSVSNTATRNTQTNFTITAPNTSVDMSELFDTQY